MSGAKHAHGTVLTIAATVDELTSCNGPNINVDQIDVTNMDSTDAWREFIPGLKDGGEVPFEGNFIKAEITALMTLLAAGTVTADCTLVLPSSLGTFTFDSFVSSLNVGAEVSGKVSASGSLKVTGAVVFS